MVRGMNTFEIEFDGALLKRGFWLYVWRVRSWDRTVLYVGRTGDSSSRFASSPFARVGQHLDLRPNATANCLARRLSAAGLAVESCRYSLMAIGPLFPEQPDLQQHRLFRDRMARLEARLAAELRERGYEVLGKHPARGNVDAALWAMVVDAINTPFPDLHRFECTSE